MVVCCLLALKRQAQEPIKQAALQSAQYFVNRRWLGGTLTNWQTVSNSIQRLRNLDEVLSSDTSGFTKKEVLNMTRERDRLELSVGGIRNMGSTPDLLVVIDTNRESIAVKEARGMGILCLPWWIAILIPPISPIQYLVMMILAGLFPCSVIASRKQP